MILIVLCAVLTVACLSSAQAEEPTAITLSCDGTTKAYVNGQESINPVTKMDVVVNVAERRVSFDGRVAHIDQIVARTIYFGGNSLKDTTGYIDGKTGGMTATNMDGREYDELYVLVCPAATGAFSGLHDVAASGSGKVEITHQRAGVSAHDRHKMKKAARHTPQNSAH
jgi:opacity protein-like surface antigen